MGKMTLEELLNKLIEKGWRPYGCKAKDMENWTPEQPCKWLERTNMEDGCTDVRSYRDICSKESGLWQFVCENEMVEIEYGKIREKYDETKDKVITFRNLLGEDNYEYRLIESALCDEDKLEQFLLDNIKIGGQ